MLFNFIPFMPVLFQHEGGYVNDKRDPGGETNYGISKRSYPKENISGMTKSRAQEIYKRDFWDRIWGDKLPSGVDIVVFDAAVNSGPSRAVKWLQEIVGVKQDGIIGPVTISATERRDALDLISRYSERRLSFMRSAKDSKGNLLWPTFGKGWSKRVSSVAEYARSVHGGSSLVVDTAPRRTLLQLIIELVSGLFKK